MRSIHARPHKHTSSSSSSSRRIVSAVAQTAIADYGGGCAAARVMPRCHVYVSVYSVYEANEFVYISVLASVACVCVRAERVSVYMRCARGFQFNNVQYDSHDAGRKTRCSPIQSLAFVFVCASRASASACMCACGVCLCCCSARTQMSTEHA